MANAKTRQVTNPISKICTMQDPPRYTLQANTYHISKKRKLEQTGTPTDRQIDNILKSHKIHGSEVKPTSITQTNYFGAFLTILR